MLSSTLRRCSIFNFTASTHIIKCHSTFLHNQTHPPTSFHALCRGYHSNSLLESVITSITLCSSIPVCRLIHSRVIKCLNYNDCFIGDRLVSLYARLGFLYDAHHLFDEIPNRDLVSWNSFISVFSQMGEVGLSLNAFCRMRHEDGMIPNEITLISLISGCGIVEGGYVHGFAVKSGLLSERKVVNSLINMYGKHGCLNVASALFRTIELPNLVSWNSMIKIHVQNSVLEKGVLYFIMMRRVEVYPDQATIVTILQCCADIGVGKLADAFHGYILCSGLDKSIPTMTALLNVYAKSGRLTASCEIFKEMKEPDMIAWTAMLAAYAMHGYGRHAIDHFDLMVKKGFEPDHVTFTHLLSACSHSGLVNEGKQLFNEMSSVYKVKPRLDHYSCMIDLFGRSGRLKDARVLIDSMPMEPNSGVWGALLNGCKVYGDIKLGEEVAQKLINLNPSDPRNYIMLSSIYSKAGRWVDFSRVRALMKDQGLVKTAGCSFIEHDHKIHRFVVSDQAHPDIERIYAKLNELMSKIEKVGYVANTEFVLHDVEEDVKGDLVKMHSEKLAIAFGLLVYSDNVPIIITKNLRICGDCHNMAKFVSRVEKRVIIIRDTRRFHHFADGLCSCGDYW
ncbi:putative tetratricopeptide-like helical domain superfamily, DYW domain-containing protein [Helianthus annuus]|nr:putative tetratricopeptide-like helical domain superfamily, DYW domain-containing protein [Helianthus annuus]KAJ0466543.1 putative tetratricopeptide-like helical domain superfamily, DYW domain-containing protein [Helianthus annuus]KAJ0654750.1 putative tetratricopeptide-like helical domain superfamily, DYW domain-containing protein [Helianthus annuus]KAJ0838632.1 putative tetratricopeptide-like helical domain superfamily, DYW domain-containing protein [Helianthus annuus]